MARASESGLDRLPETLTRSLAQASDQGGSTTTTLSVTSIRGTDTSFNVAESLFGIFGLGATVSSSSKEATAADLKATFNSSTVVTKTNATLDQVTLNDQDVTNGCSLPHCHLPLPDRPTVNIYLDKMFGGFMFQDPAAPSADKSAAAVASMKDRVEFAIAAVKSGSISTRKAGA